MYPWHDSLEVIRSSMSPCRTLGGMVDEFKDNLICQTKILKKKTDGTRKRVRTEVSDSSTSNDNWPRFLIIEPVSEGELNLFISIRNS